MNITHAMIDEYENYLQRDEKSVATIKKYIHDINRFYDFLELNKEITKEQVIMFKKELIESYKSSTVNSMLIAVNAFLKYYKYNEMTVKLLKIQKNNNAHSDRELTKIEYMRLLETSKRNNNRKLNLLIQTMCCTGIRVSEHKFITVECLNKGYSVIRNKGKVREIHIPKKLCESLLKYCKDNSIVKGPIFLTKNGLLLNRSNIWKMMKALCEESKVDKNKVFPHNLRHLFALTYYQIEKDLVKLADILGHNNIETTRIYTSTNHYEFERVYKNMGLFCG